jgi:DNA-directed RNA polymerase subunit beta'
MEHNPDRSRRKQYEDGIITDGERKSKIISIWTEVTDCSLKSSSSSISQPKRR